MLTPGPVVKNRLIKGVRVLYDDDIIEEPLKDYETIFTEEYADGVAWYRCIKCRHADQSEPEACPSCGRIVKR